MHAIGRLLFALCAPLLLSACLLTPGKFASTLDIRADRSFTFTYKGEVIAFDMSREMMKGLPGSDTPGEEKEGREDGTSGSSITPAALAEEGQDARLRQRRGQRDQNEGDRRGAVEGGRVQIRAICREEHFPDRL